MSGAAGRWSWRRRPGALGLSICYDLRFAGLYAALSNEGATILSIPAAFTVPTGEAHWHVLLRARAIEAGAFVVAAAQVGQHEDGRVTYGHSLVVDPWGKVLLDMGGGRAGSRLCRDRSRRGRGGPQTAARHLAPPADPAARACPLVIIFDLKCAPQGHVFEAWFGSGEDYEAQKARGLVSCPLCGSGEVDKAPMAPSVGREGQSGGAVRRRSR